MPQMEPSCKLSASLS